jgi:hypothetical protein
MDKQTIIRRVRIAVSVFFGVLTVALLVLWVRSYWRIDLLRRDIPQMHIQSGQGVIQVMRWNRPHSGIFASWQFDSIQPDFRRFPQPTGMMPQLPRVARSRLITAVSIPFWTPTVACLILAIVPVCIASTRKQFSLRTMLIATTLIAVVLGLGVWLAR